MSLELEWKEALPVYVVLDGCGQIIAGGFDSREDAIRSAKLINEPVEIEARKTLSRRIWCTWDDEEWT